MKPFFQTRARALVFNLFLLCQLTEAQPSSGAETAESPHTARIETEKLRLVIADNAAFGTHHRAGYNGVAELTGAGELRNLFVPNGPSIGRCAAA